MPRRLRGPLLVSHPVNTIPYPVVPAKAGIHAQHNQNTTSGMDPHRRGDDNNVPKLQNRPLAYYKRLGLTHAQVPQQKFLGHCVNSCDNPCHNQICNDLQLASQQNLHVSSHVQHVFDICRAKQRYEPLWGECF